MIVHTASNAHAILALIEDGERVTSSTAGYSAPNIRYASAVGMMRFLLSERRRLAERVDPGRGLYLFQYDDHAFQDVRSVALGRHVGHYPLLELIVDPYFFFSRGFEELRALSANGDLPAWSDRSDRVFWRGRGSSNGLTLSGAPIQGLEDIPRVQLALRLRDDPQADVGLIGAWNQQAEAETEEALARARILRPAAPMREHAHHRFQLDIDGVANAWATLERFLCGSCVLKVASPFEMWFYPSLHAWTHYVPVKADLSDLEQQLHWCRSHPQDARSIAEAGRRFALDLTYDVAIAHSVRALGDCRLDLD